MPLDSAPGEQERDRHGHLRLSVRTSDQLFNSFDPSPFYEKDLDADAENVLVSWAGDLHPHADLRLTLYLKELPAGPTRIAGSRGRSTTTLSSGRAWSRRH